ncbi:MAG: response regulator [Halodesulfovibrio sp.]
MRFLIIDDDRVSRARLSAVLTQYGQCDVAETIDQGFESFCEAWTQWQPYDLVTIDISLAEENGIDLLIKLRDAERARNVSKNKRTLIFMVTSHHYETDIHRSVFAECDEYILKPFYSFDLKERLEKYGFSKLQQSTCEYY